MAKELPYFKFEPSEWQNGNIQMCSPVARASFLDICCSYWQRLGKMPYAFALRMHCGGDAGIIDELENSGSLKIVGDFLKIGFLDSQIKEISEKSEKARKSAEARWSKKGKNANVMRTHSESNAIREDKIREEEIRKDNNSEVSKKKPFEGGSSSVERFVNWFNERKKTLLGSAGRFKALSPENERNYKKLKKYSLEDFETASFNMSKNPWVIKNKKFDISHFLRVDNFNKYLNQESVDSEGTNQFNMRM